MNEIRPPRDYAFVGGPLHGLTVDTDYTAEFRDHKGRCERTGADPSAGWAYRFDDQFEVYRSIDQH